jgi:hypothetical protein
MSKANQAKQQEPGNKQSAVQDDLALHLREKKAI